MAADIIVNAVVGDVARSQCGKAWWWSRTSLLMCLWVMWCVRDVAEGGDGHGRRQRHVWACVACSRGGPGSVRRDGEKGVGGLVSLIWMPRGEGLLTCLFVPFGKVLVENKEVDWKVD